MKKIIFLAIIIFLVGCQTSKNKSPTAADPCKSAPDAVDCPTGDADGDGTNNAIDPDSSDPCKPDSSVKACTDTIDKGLGRFETKLKRMSK